MDIAKGELLSGEALTLRRLQHETEKRKRVLTADATARSPAEIAQFVASKMPPPPPPPEP